MRAGSTLVVAAVCLFLETGCQLAVTGTHNLLSEAALTVEECRAHRRYQRQAEEAWAARLGDQTALTSSRDYAQGFKDGFADYLEAGGDAQPPCVPPRHYWSGRYQTPDGYRAIEDWYLGYGRGAYAAQLSGYRQWVTLPVGVLTSYPPRPLPDAGVPAGAAAEVLPPISVPVRAKAGMPPPGPPASLPKPAGEAASPERQLPLVPSGSSSGPGLGSADVSQYVRPLAPGAPQDSPAGSLLLSAPPKAAAPPRSGPLLGIETPQSSLKTLPSGNLAVTLPWSGNLSGGRCHDAIL